jgi:gluconate 2-dehydrogenase gamma chain
MSNLPSRRQALIGATLTFGTLWTTLSLPCAATAQTTLSWSPKVLTQAQAQVLEVAVELIMPATDTPGAREAGVARFIDRGMSNFYDPAQVKTMRDGLDRMQTDAMASYNTGFAALDERRQIELLTRYDAEATKLPLSHFFALIRQATIVGFFTSETGATKTLRYDPVPGAYRGCVPLKEIGRAWAT